MGNLLEYKNKSHKKKETEGKPSTKATQFGSFGTYAIGKVMENTLKPDTLQSDLSSLSKTIGNVYNGWQTQETLANARSSIESMYNRLGKYQEYQKKYGGTDLSEVQKSFKSVLDGWDDISKHYGQYKDADSFNEALKSAKKQAKEYEGMKTADLGTVQTEIADLESVMKTVKEHESIINRLKVKQNTWGSRTRGMSGEDEYSSKVKAAEDELNEYLKSVGYESTDAIKKALGEKKVYKNKAEWIQKGIEMSSVGLESSENYDKDFNEKATYVPGTTGHDMADDVYEFINGDEDKKLRMVSKITGNADAYLATGGYEHMTDQEVLTYNYYYNQFGKDKAKEYLNTIAEDLANRKALDRFEQYEGKLGSELLFGVEAGLDQFATGLKNLVNTSDEYIPINATQQMSGLVRQDINYEHGALGQVGYDLINTTSNMLPSILTSTVISKFNPALGANVGSALMGASASGNAYQEMLNLGYDKGQSRVYSAVVGASEAYLQKVLGGIGALGGTSGKIANAVKSIDNAAARFAIQWGGSMASEALEEGLQEVLTPFFESFAAGYDTGAEVDWGEAFYSALLGGLSGGMLEGPSLAINSYAENSFNKNMGKTIKANERVGELFDIASDPEVASAYETYTRYANKGINADNITDAQLGRLYTEAKTEAVETIGSKKSTDEQRAKARMTLMKLGVVDSENTLKKAAKETAKGFKVGEETEVDINNVKLNGDKFTVATENGEVAVDETTISKTEAELLGIAKEFAKNEGESLANAFIAQYDGETDVYEYANSFNRTIEYAKGNFTFDYILNNKGELSAQAVKEIYKQTRIEADKKKKAEFQKLAKQMGDKKFYKGFVDDSAIDYNNTSDEGKVNWNDLTSKQRNAVIFIKGFAQATGMNVEFVANNPLFNGRYNRDTNVLSINLDNMNDTTAEHVMDAVIPAMSHETTHWMRKKSPELWRHLNDIVFSTLVEHYNSNTEQALKDKAALLDSLGINYSEDTLASHNITEFDLVNKEYLRLVAKNKKQGKAIDKEALMDEAREEIIARACEDLLKMSKQGRKIFSSLSETEQKTLFEKIKAIIKDLLEWIDNALNSYEATSTEARIMREYKEQLQKASKVWDAMLEDSVKVNQALEKSGAYGNAVDSRDSSELLSAKNVDGKNVVWIEENILKENEGQPVHQFIADFIAEHIGEVYTIIESGQKVYIGEDLPGEYTQSQYTQTILRNNPNIIKVKNKASANIGEIIEIATNRKWEKAEHEDNKDAKYGIYKYNTRFGFPVKDAKGNTIGANIYKAKLVIRNASDGKKYLYDIVSIKKDNASSDWLSKKIASTATKIAAQKNDASTDSILNSDKNVKKNISDKEDIRFSMKENVAVVNILESAKNGELYSEKVSEITEDEYKNMKNHFGVTGDFRVAGYMLKSGHMLDFSGKHWGDTTSKSRQVDHRDIQEALPDENNGVDSMVNMISNGNIRLMPEIGGINLAVAPSKNQRAVLRRYIEYMSPKEGIIVDIDKVGGDTIKSFTYDKGTSADRVMRDIDNYFKGGTQSELMRFHTAEGDILYSEKPFAEQVDEVLAGTFDRATDVYVGKLPKILQDVGLDGDLPMLALASHIRKANKPKDSKKHQHGLTDVQIKSIPNKIANPVMIMDSLDETKNSIVVVTDMLDVDKSPIVVSIKADGRGRFNRVEVESNFLTGYYGRDGFANFIKNNVIEDTFLYINKEKATILETESSTSWLEQLKNYDFNIIIRKTRANVKKNISDKEDVRFSMKENVEETKDLIAVHNLSPDKLLKSLKLGGLPMPSIAITRAREGYNNFGDISLVFNKDTIDPQFMRRNKVYSGDAWTPTYPQVEYKLNTKAQEQIKKKIDNLIPKNIQDDLGGLHLDSTNMEYDLNRHGDMVKSYRYNYPMKYAFLKDNDVNLELPTKEEPFYRYGEVSNSAVISFAHKMVEGLKTVNSLLEQHSSKLMADAELINGIATVLNEDAMSTVDEDSEAYQKLVENPLFKPEDVDLSTVLGMLEAARKYFHSNGKAESKIDYRIAREKIDDYFNSNSLEKDYEYWLNKLFADVIEKEGIRNNKDLFTPSGNRRSFEALHYEHNLENVIKVMKEQGDKGVGGFGGGNIFGASTREYGSIEDIKADAENRMESLPESKYDEIKKGFSDRLFELASSLPINKNSFSALDDAANMLIEAVLKFKTKSGMANYLRSESKGWANYSDYIVDDLVELVNDIRNMPAAYFEAKPQRAVGFDEIKAVIMPAQESYEDDLSEVKSELEKLGVPIHEYEYGDNDARIKALNSLDNVLFSEKETTSVYDIMGEKERLLKENKKLMKDLDRLKERLRLEKKVTGGNYFEEKSLNAVAVYLRKIASSTYAKDTLSEELKTLYTYVKGNMWSGENLFGKAYELAEKILADAKPLVETNDYAKSILREIRGKRISLTETQKQEAKNAFGDKYLNAFFGKIVIANDGISLDSQWQEWASLYPGLFKEGINEGDQITELYDVYNDLRDASETIREYDMEEQARWLAEEILNKYWNVSRIVTTADKYDMQIKVLNFEHRQTMKEMRDDYKQKLKEQHKDDKSRYTELVKKIRERKDEQIAIAKQHGRDMLDKYKDNAERKTRIQSITANALSLNEMLVKNSKDKHIPEILREPVTAMLQALDFSSKRLLDKGIPTQKDISLSKALSKVKDMMVKASNAHNDLVELYGHGLDEDIETMVDSVDNIMRSVGDNEFVLNQMTAQDLQTLDKMVKTIRQAVNKLNKFHTVNHAKGIANLSKESVEYLDSLGKGKIYDGKRGAAKKLLDWGNALPYYVFKRFGSGGMKVYEAIQDGWDKFAFNVKKIIDYANKVYTSKEVKEWSEEVKTFKVLVPASELDMASGRYTPQYQEVQLTVPQIMSLYCLNKREQARKHLFQGGIRVADFKTKKGEVVSQSDGIIFTEKAISTILNSLTGRQKAVADRLQGFMNTVCAEWGNEVSMARFGYKAFGEDNYFPIQSDKNNLAVNDETEQINSLFKLLNMSFTKATDSNANNRIVISDIFDVFAQHTSDMAKYNALALPVLDSFKWYNYTERQDVADGTFKTSGVKQSIEKAFGKDGQNYFTTFLKDINGQQEVSRDTLGKGFFKNAKIAAVGANLRVVLLQPTSYARASAVIDNKYLTKALAHKPKIKKAEEYCGIALWKSMGYYDTNIQKGVEAQIKHNDTWKDKAVEWSMKGAEVADKVTWGYLWNACELEVRDTRKDLKVGSKEFYDAISKRLREVIYATQVVDSTMTRSQMMRSSDGWDKMLTAFASEATLSYNMLQDAYMEYSLNARRMGKAEAIKKNGKHIARVVYAYTMTNAVAALVESAFDAYRDDDDEEMDMIEFMKLYFKNFALDMSIGNKIPVVKELYSLLQGYSSSRMDTQWAQYLQYALNAKKPAKKLKYMIQFTSQLSGLPFYNVYRDTMAALNKLDLFTEEDLNKMFEDFLG